MPATAMPARISTFPTGRDLNVTRATPTTASVPSELPTIARTRAGQRSRTSCASGISVPETCLERDCDRDADREPDVDERDRRDPPLPDEQERPDAEERRRQERAAEVVDAERRVAPTRRGAPGERAGSERVGAEARSPGRELGSAPPADTGARDRRRAAA